MSREEAEGGRGRGDRDGYDTGSAMKKEGLVRPLESWRRAGMCTVNPAAKPTDFSMGCGCEPV